MLRSMLIGSAILLSVVAPLADGTVYLHDVRILSSVVAPTMMLIMVFVLLLDITMSRVFAVDAEEPKKAALHMASWIEAVALCVLLGAWTPFILKLLNP